MCHKINSQNSRGSLDWTECDIWVTEAETDRKKVTGRQSWKGPKCPTTTNTQRQSGKRLTSSTLQGPQQVHRHWASSHRNDFKFLSRPRTFHRHQTCQAELLYKMKHKTAECPLYVLVQPCVIEHHVALIKCCNKQMQNRHCDVCSNFKGKLKGELRCSCCDSIPTVCLRCGSPFINEFTLLLFSSNIPPSISRVKQSEERKQKQPERERHEHG